MEHTLPCGHRFLKSGPGGGGAVLVRRACEMNGRPRWEWPEETHHLHGKEKLRLGPGRGRETRGLSSTHQRQHRGSRDLSRNTPFSVSRLLGAARVAPPFSHESSLRLGGPCREWGAMHAVGNRALPCRA